jgi:hypothetical protein
LHASLDAFVEGPTGDAELAHLLGRDAQSKA